jgi:hypothetical protein
MSQPETVPPEAVRDLLYKEYVRLHDKMDTYASASFADFKLLAVVGAGASVAIKVGHGVGVKNVDVGPRLAPMTAFAMLALVAILAFRDLLKQSLIYGLVPHLKALEHEIRTRFGLANSRVFLLNTSIDRWHATHAYAVRWFGSSFAVSIAGLPAATLWQVDQDVL